ncbi:MAG: hypothetical protein PHW03_02410 [Eubacteriales bacterium]|nr:hypothetical protein [Eubacteriales bacterium]MDD4389635.1 hypothetical protein [Eubacteriales bacterium]
MNYDELMTILDIEEPEEFSYFENMADFLESEGEIERDALYRLIDRVDKNVLSDILIGYIDDVCENIPEGEVDLFLLFSNLKLSLSGLSKQSNKEDSITVILVDELLRFRHWYSQEKGVPCFAKDNKAQSNVVTVAEAVAMARLEKMGEEEFTYDFGDILEYEIDEYVMSFTEIFDDDEYDSDDFMHIDDPLYDDDIE